jgi:hypothetical protein
VRSASQGFGSFVAPSRRFGAVWADREALGGAIADIDTTAVLTRHDRPIDSPDVEMGASRHRTMVDGIHRRTRPSRRWVNELAQAKPRHWFELLSGRSLCHVSSTGPTRYTVGAGPPTTSHSRWRGAHLRTLRLADGPDEVHKRAIA